MSDPKQPQISIKGDTLDRLRQTIGEQAIGPFVDRLITDYLDEHAPIEPAKAPTEIERG